MMTNGTGGTSSRGLNTLRTRRQLRVGYPTFRVRACESVVLEEMMGECFIVGVFRRNLISFRLLILPRIMGRTKSNSCFISLLPFLP